MIPRLDFLEILCLKLQQALLKVKISFCVFTILFAYSAITRKVFKRLWRIRGIYLGIHEEYEKS
jgi:hypothetical protein